MNTPSELTTFKGVDDAHKFFYLFENVVTKSIAENETAEKIVAYLIGVAFGFYSDRLTLDNAPTEEATGCDLIKKVMLEKFSTQKTESETMIEALTNRYHAGDIPTCLTRADKIYISLKLVRMSNSSYFEIP